MRKLHQDFDLTKENIVINNDVDRVAKAQLDNSIYEAITKKNQRFTFMDYAGAGIVIVSLSSVVYFAIQMFGTV